MAPRGESKCSHKPSKYSEVLKNPDKRERICANQHYIMFEQKNVDFPNAYYKKEFRIKVGVENLEMFSNDEFTQALNQIHDWLLDI